MNGDNSVMESGYLTHMLGMLVNPNEMCVSP